MAGNEKVPYINYKELEEFYSIADSCRLLKLTPSVSIIGLHSKYICMHPLKRF